MKLLILNYEYPPLGGGAGNATYYLLKEFAKNKDIEIDLITSSVGRFRKEQISERIFGHFLDIGKGGNLHYQTGRDLLTYTGKAFNYANKLIAEKKPELVHAFFGIPCGHIAMQLGLPYIVSLRGSDVPFYNERFELQDKLLFQHLSRVIWSRAKATVANSKGLKDLALQTNTKIEIQVIYNGIDANRFNVAKKKRGERSDKTVLISTGRLIHRKGYEHLLKALENKPEFELVLIGDGDLRGKLEKLSDDLNVKAKFLGPQQREKVIDNLHRADVFVLPSLNEGMSNSVLEALACGLPVISTDVGGAHELVEDGKNGFVVRRADSFAIAQALQRYSSDPSLAKKHGIESRRIAKGLSWAKVSRQYLEVYSRVVF
jgi:glycosyltransferase involved in cell wall biosynthesis